MGCDMCGSETKLFKAIIENVEMNVCRDCSKFGKIVGEIKPFEKPKKTERFIREKGPDRELLQVIAEDYANIIKKAREDLNLTQKEFAQKINEKESLVHKIETGSFEPNLSLARKLEKFLKIRIVEQHEEVRKKGLQSESDTFTIGDFIKVKKR